MELSGYFGSGRGEAEWVTVISLMLITGIDQLKGNLLTLFKNNTGLSGSDCDLEREEL